MIGFNWLEINNRFNDGGTLAYELPSSGPSRRRWVAIVQPEFTAGDKRAEYEKFFVRDFEIEIALMDPQYDDLDTVNEVEYFARSPDELFTYLARKGYDLDSFTYPWKCDYPF